MNDSDPISDKKSADDEFFHKEKNAQDYFQELEENGSIEAKKNSDGASIFSQTGGRFLNRASNNNTGMSMNKKENSKEKMVKTVGESPEIKKPFPILKNTGSNFHGSQKKMSQK